MEKAIENKIRQILHSVKKLRLGVFRYEGKVFLTFCWLVLLIATVYSSVQASNIQLTTSDQFITTYIFGAADQGRPMISSDHTNLLKFPLLWLQEKLPYGYVSYIGLNIIFVFSALALWSILVGRILGRAALPIILLVFSAVIINSPTFTLNITMTTLRHIEYPLALLYLLGLYQFFKPNRKYLSLTVGMTLYLSLLLLNDRYFLYTLVPAAFFSVTWFYFIAQKNARDVRSPAYALFSISAGSILGILLPMLLTFTGLISIVPGYADINYLISFEGVLGSILLSIQQTLDLFGGSIFGQEMRKLNISLFMGLVIFFIAAAGFIKANRDLKSTLSDKRSFLHIGLAVFALFVYLAYIMPDFAKPYNARYLTAIVFIGATYFTYFIWSFSKQYKTLPYLAAAFLIATTILSVPRVDRLYSTATASVSSNLLHTKAIANALQKRNIRLVVTPGGHYDIGFQSGGSVDSIQLLNKCSTPSPWANNSAWINEGMYSKTAFVINTTSSDPTAKLCTPSTVTQIYGSPNEIIPIATSQEGIKVLYIYNFDIRTKFDLSNIR